MVSDHWNRLLKAAAEWPSVGSQHNHEQPQSHFQSGSGLNIVVTHMTSSGL